MFRRIILAPILALGLALPAAALDLGAMTNDERAAFRAEVRAYLLENPEVLMEAIAVLEQRQKEDQIGSDRDAVAANAAALFEDPNAWVGGNPDGDVTIVEFMDYRCSFCRKAHPEVRELLNSDGNIRYIVKEYPILGEESVAATRFAIATRMVAGDEAYEDVHNVLITVRGSMTNDTFSRIAENLGLDPDPILAEMGNPEIDTIIQQNYRLAERLKISGTPSFVFGTEMVRGYVPLDTMEAIVAELRKVQ